MLTLATIKDEANVFSTVPVVSLLTSSKIHLDLSNVWNDYKVEQVTLTATPLGVEDLITEEGGVIDQPREYLKLFCAWDNNDVSHQLRYSDIKTYESYKDVTYSLTANNETPILRFSTDPKMKKMDTKKTPNYGTLIIGINSPIIFGDSVDINISVNFTFTVCYGTSRLDTSWVSTLIAPDFQQLPDTLDPKPVLERIRIGVNILDSIAEIGITDAGWQTTAPDGITYITIPPHHHVIWWGIPAVAAPMWSFYSRDNDRDDALQVNLGGGRRYYMLDMELPSFFLTLVSSDNTRIATSYFQEDYAPGARDYTSLAISKSLVTFPPGTIFPVN